MAYGFVVGSSSQVKDQPSCVGSIDFDERATLCSLAKNRNSSFLNQVTNLFQDQSFSILELQQAQQQLLGLLPLELPPEEKVVLHKLIAVVTYALYANQPLHGVAD